MSAALSFAADVDLPLESYGAAGALRVDVAAFDRAWILAAGASLRTATTHEHEVDRIRTAPAMYWLGSGLRLALSRTTEADVVLGLADVVTSVAALDLPGETRAHHRAFALAFGRAHWRLSRTFSVFSEAGVAVALHRHEYVVEIGGDPLVVARSPAGMLRAGLGLAADTWW